MASYSNGRGVQMLTQNQEKFLESLYEMRDDMIRDINLKENELVDCRVRLKQINIAILNLEAECKVD